MLGAIAGIAAVVVTVGQLLYSFWLSQRQRDGEMTRWGADVIGLMAELETAASPLSAETDYTSAEIERLGHRASALLDYGRLFFANVKSVKSHDDEGIRVKILDQVLRACYVARYLATHPDADGFLLRRHMWEARRTFVTLLQKEMGCALKRSGIDSQGEHVPKDPLLWIQPTRQLILPSGSKVYNSAKSD